MQVAGHLLFPWKQNPCTRGAPVGTVLLDVSVNDLNNIRQKAGGLIAMLPKDVSILSDEIKEQVLTLEKEMLTQSIPVPVYFAPYNPNLEHIINDITQNSAKNNAKNEDAFAHLLMSVSANGYHVTVDGQNGAVNKNSKIPIIQGELVPSQFALKHVDNAGESTTLPLILITTNLKTFGITNDYPLNADVAVVMSLVEIFSKLHSVISTSPKYRLAFLISDAGLLLNFQGSKKWLETDDNMSLQNVEFVLSLDTITQSLAQNQPNAFYMHVSKPPKEKTPISHFFKLLKTVTGRHSENATVEGIHKKINLAESKISWEHERFSMKRFPAFTLSSVKNPSSSLRTTIFKDNEARTVAQTLTTVKIIAETLACYIYKIDPMSDVFEGHVVINENNVLPYLGIKSVLQNNDIKDGFEKYLANVKITYDKPDARDPDFMFYNGIDPKLNVYRVKPAVFDLFLTLIVSLYLCSVYFAIQFFPRFYNFIAANTKELFCGQVGNTQNATFKRKNN
ncbi:CG4972 [Drosophila busckii]|uniref:CG4972 n=1 Tax=Drosophila busckii TaxID=30019 RepID=A0A0M4E8D3_DROBS|nr:CG4972 [Drosophila busckii]